MRTLTASAPGRCGRWLPPLKLGFAYGFVVTPDMKVDQFRGPLAGRVSGENNEVYFHFLFFNAAYQF